MALPTTDDSWMQGFDLPSLLENGPFGGTDYELYEDDGEFVLSIEMPGFSTEEIDLAWDDGVLNIAAEHVDEGDRQHRQKTYHRRFRFPKDVDEDAIEAVYTNGVLEVRLPIEADAAATGTKIPIET